jgi:uncharacterized radical SAM protein YgiQ
MTPPKLQPLPVSWEECRQRGWKAFDVLLVTGDAYVDHPSFGIALIGRYLEHHGYRVAILSQPHFDTAVDFTAFPAPQLFCGITGGNLDSIVANYSGNGKVRDTDAYSPGGSPWRSTDKNKNNRYRPDRASLIYANLARSAYKNTPIILGGLEASLRRFVHYDYKQEKLRASFLTDAKADLLIYGMGEHAVLEIARKCRAGESLEGVTGCCERLTDRQLQELYPDGINTNASLLVLPSLAEIEADQKRFLDAELALDKHARAASRKNILQRQQNHWVLQHPAAAPLNPEELDTLYELPYTRKPHPATPDIPAYRMIKDSITIVRGCSGNCSFCAITRHQGATIQNRSVDSIVRECRTLASMDDFKGTISDLGGPTANLYGTSCAIGSCKKQDCLYPKVCKHLTIDEELFIKLLQEVSSIENIRHVFISSGLRMELLLRTPKLLQKLISSHIPGAMKIAPEHSSDEVLRLMHKEPHQLLKTFVNLCKKMTSSSGKPLQVIPYVISSHPGCTDKHAADLARDMAALGLKISKFQDFTPTPGTISTAMYVTGLDRENHKPIFVAKNTKERLRQRTIIENTFPQSHKDNTKKYGGLRKKKK